MAGEVGARPMVNVNVWMSGSRPLLADIVRMYTPSSPASGVPLRVAVPSPLFTKLTLAGNAGLLVAVMVDTVGAPLVVTLNVPKLPMVNAVLSMLVMSGDSSTVRIKDCVVSPTPLLAVIVSG